MTIRIARHEIRTVRLGAGASAAAPTSTRRRGFATSSSTTSRPRRSATTRHSWSSITSPASARCRRASICSPGWRRAPRRLRLGTAVHGAALAQPGAARRTGRDHRPALGRAARIRRRQGLSRTTNSPASAFRSRRPRSASRNRSALILKAWTCDERFSHHGKYLEFREHRGRAADEAEAASADLDGGGPAGLDPQGGAARRQAAARPVRLDRADDRALQHLQGRGGGRRASASTRWMSALRARSMWRRTPRTSARRSRRGSPTSSA